MRRSHTRVAGLPHGRVLVSIAGLIGSARCRNVRNVVRPARVGRGMAHRDDDGVTQERFAGSVGIAHVSIVLRSTRCYGTNRRMPVSIGKESVRPHVVTWGQYLLCYSDVGAT